MVTGNLYEDFKNLENEYLYRIAYFEKMAELKPKNSCPRRAIEAQISYYNNVLKDLKIIIYEYEQKENFLEIKE